MIWSMVYAAAAVWLIAGSVVGPTLVAGAQTADCDVEDLTAPCPLADGTTVQGTIRQQGGRNYYWFGAPVSAMHLRIDLVDLPADYDLYLFSDQSPDPTRPFSQSSALELAPEVIDLVLADAGTYLVEVVSDPGQPFDPLQPYTLVFGLVAPPVPTPTPEPPAATPTPEPARVTSVPPLVSHGGGAAAAEVRAAGLQPRVRIVDRFSLGGEGTVAAQDPPAGTLVGPNTVVDILVASGNVEVPQVAGLSEQAAWNLLQASGFKIDTRRATSGSVARGQAMSVTPNPGQVIPSGASVVLFISQGE
jgi:hypothetical protein